MKNNYWLKRRDELYQRELNTSIKELANYYTKLYKATEADLLSLLDEIERGIIHEGGINEREVLPSDLYRAQRFTELLSNFNANAVKFGSKEINTINQTLSDMIYKQRELTTIELGESKSFSLNLVEDVQKAMNAVWAPDGKNWSERIWTNKAIMEEELRQGIINIIANGYDSKKLAMKLTSYLQDTTTKGFNRAFRLVRTELSYVQTQACLDKYKEAGVEYYEILAANGACSDCASQYAGKRFRIDEAVVGVNCPPFHPNCRCTTLAVIGGKQ